MSEAMNSSETAPTTGERNYETGLRASWLELENFKAMKPLATGRCRACNAFRSPGSLCLDCNDRRLALKERFNLFPVPQNTVETIEEITPAPTGPEQPRIVVTEPQYRFPYKD